MLVPESTYQTLGVTERYYFDELGTLDSQQVSHTIRALGPLNTVTQTLPGATARVKDSEGGYASMYESEPGQYAADIMLNAPLKPGQETTIGFEILSGPNAPQPNEVRYAVGEQALDLTVELVFNNRAVPKRIWRVIWPSLTAAEPLSKELIDAEPYELDPEYSVVTGLAFAGLTNTVVGFRWEWPEDVRMRRGIGRIDRELGLPADLGTDTSGFFGDNRSGW